MQRRSQLKNIGTQLSIDETALSQGELYTVITNKKAKGKKGALVVILSGTKVKPVVKQLLKIFSFHSEQGAENNP